MCAQVWVCLIPGHPSPLGSSVSPPTTTTSSVPFSAHGMWTQPWGLRSRAVSRREDLEELGDGQVEGEREQKGDAF